MDVLAHRLRTGVGQTGNSRANLTALYAMGITWLETDASFSEDGKILIHHPGKVKPNVDVMDLLTFLGIISSLPKMHCCLDIKEDSEELVRKIVFLITELKLEDRVYLTAFQRKVRIPLVARLETDGKLLLLAKKLNPKIKTHLIVTWPWNLPKIAKKYRADAISFGWLLEPDAARFISKILFRMSAAARNLPRQVAKTKADGIKVWSGICNDPKDWLYLVSLNVDGIMTDEPEKLMDFIKKQKVPA